ncbi:hypothetical protein PLICBS_010620 [Purpureocillium lilacinum]|uniref:uncharacterized protein n=1 Tax=Purpureocillium lilacinum TaxID=33203 RepID=UPI0020835E65|nr:hypothetical protein PLICBS_010620 [Purpureocillium lilacinum]
MPPLNYIRTAATEGPVARTEIGSPVQKANLKSVGLGVTTAYGRTQMESGFARAMTYAGASVPKVRTNGEGWIGGEWHVVTSASIELENLVQVPGQRGEIRKQADGAGGNGGGGNAGRNNIVSKLFARFALQKRADNINQNFEYKFRVPRGLSCTGTNSTSGTAPGDNNNGGSTDDNSLTGPAKDTKGPASPAPGADNGSPNGGNKSGGTDDNTIDGGGNNNKNGNDNEGKGHSKDKVRRFFTA